MYIQYIYIFIYIYIYIYSGPSLLPRMHDYCAKSPRPFASALRFHTILLLNILYRVWSSQGEWGGSYIAQ